VVPGVEPISAEGERLVEEVRATPAPFETLVTGPSAELVDTKDSLAGRLPLAGAIIGLVTFVLLFLMTGSILVPIKAIVLNLLSLTATFGAMVWIFQEGNLSGLLNFTATGTLDTSMPILMFCIAFGLSMDYEVFLLSRIKEEHDRTGDNLASVAMGLERTGRIVTAAAAVLSVVFIAFATSGITFIKMFGVGMALAVLVDATLIRAALVPAFMRLAGDANWWAPRPLRRVYERIGLHEAPEADVPVVLPRSAEASRPEERV
jgi:putative drug exporter of the RND superfamily